MNEEELDEIEITLKTSKPYNELGTYNYFNCESIEKLLKQNTELKDNWNKLKEWLEEEIYNIEPKGTAINYNCEYDSEEDYINAMKERSKLITLKRVLINVQEIEGGMNE